LDGHVFVGFMGIVDTSLSTLSYTVFLGQLLLTPIALPRLTPNCPSSTPHPAPFACVCFQDGPADVSLAALAAGGSSAAAAADAPPLDEDDAAIYKKRIVDLLLPGESVLLALRRLGESFNILLRRHMHM
jgi:hypothetical protein